MDAGDYRVDLAWSEDISWRQIDTGGVFGWLELGPGPDADPVVAHGLAGAEDGFGARDGAYGEKGLIAKWYELAGPLVLDGWVEVLELEGYRAAISCSSVRQREVASEVQDFAWRVLALRVALSRAGHDA